MARKGGLAGGNRAGEIRNLKIGTPGKLKRSEGGFQRVDRVPFERTPGGIGRWGLLQGDLLPAKRSLGRPVARPPSASCESPCKSGPVLPPSESWALRAAEPHLGAGTRNAPHTHPFVPGSPEGLPALARLPAESPANFGGFCAAQTRRIAGVPPWAPKTAKKKGRRKSGVTPPASSGEAYERTLGGASDVLTPF